MCKIKFKTIRDEVVILMMKNVLYLMAKKYKPDDPYELSVSFIDGSLTKFTIAPAELENIKKQLEEYDIKILKEE
jgi:ABC-type Zn uptake system ZnuABC Zn-binding protein ZnuA